MSNSDSPTNAPTVSFASNHVPALKDGKYTIDVNQSIQHLSKTNGALTAQQSKTIFVAGERYTFTANDVFYQYPIAGKTGKYANILPHIALDRSTLPWERQSVNTKGNNTPWLWLFVFNDDDIAAGNVIAPRLKQMKDVYAPIDKITDAFTFKNVMPLVVEPGDEVSKGVLVDKKVSVLQIDLAWAQSNDIIPDADTLNLLTSVRSSSTGGTQAICLANRLPKPGVRNYVCLLSMETRLNQVSDQLAYQQQGVTFLNKRHYSNFVSLTTWGFSCLPEESYQITTDGLNKVANPITPVVKDQKKPISITLSQSSIEIIQGIQLPGFYSKLTDFQSAFTKAIGTVPADVTANLNAVLECFAVPNKTFEEVLVAVDSATIGFQKLASGAAGANTEIVNGYLENAAIALPHQLNSGGKTLSWYHGPLKPGSAAASALPEVGILSSDALLRYDETLQMLDVSYAAAWELGRMLTLNNKAVSMALYAWKRQQNWGNQKASTAVAK
ncbi:MAG: hypothetical protein AAFO69_19895, partial [Bacteroidota bacterium]